ncbi:hypothetical protein KCTC32420_00119 [Aequorivita nionensis]
MAVIMSETNLNVDNEGNFKASSGKLAHVFGAQRSALYFGYELKIICLTKTKTTWVNSTMEFSVPSRDEWET